MTPVTLPEAKPGLHAGLELGGERWSGGVVIASGAARRGVVHRRAWWGARDRVQRKRGRPRVSCVVCIIGYIKKN